VSLRSSARTVSSDEDRVVLLPETERVLASLLTRDPLQAPPRAAVRPSSDAPISGERRGGPPAPGRNASFRRSAASAKAPTSTSMPCSRSRRAPRRAVRGSGSSSEQATRRTPAAMRASVQGGVRPGSRTAEVDENVAPGPLSAAERPLPAWGHPPVMIPSPTTQPSSPDGPDADSEGRSPLSAKPRRSVRLRLVIDSAWARPQMSRGGRRRRRADVPDRESAPDDQDDPSQAARPSGQDRLSCRRTSQTRPVRPLSR
jgi:hypothetical protein